MVTLSADYGYVGSMTLHRFPDARQAAEGCAKYILARLEEAIGAKGVARLAISGGSSPRPMFEIFATTRFTWDKVQLFWVDERGVKPTDSQSNFKLANETWLAPGAFLEANIHRIPAELAPDVAAQRYVADILKTFGSGTPEFDVIHQGMGPDGHTASLFPGEPAIDDRAGVAAAVWVEKFKQWRITLLPGVLLHARHTAMLVTGADKAETLRTVLHGEYDPKTYPTQIVARDGRDVNFFLDEGAAGLID
jgi:6-phosphogluconolactonase